MAGLHQFNAYVCICIETLNRKIVGTVGKRILNLVKLLSKYSKN